VTEPILRDLPESLETPRLRLRPPRAGDGPALHAALAETLADLRRFLASLPWVASEQTVATAEAYCRNAQANFVLRKDLAFLLFDRASGEIVGATGLHRTVWETPRTEIGYWCRTSRQGQGLVSEAVTAMCGYAFAHLQAVRVEIVTDEENAAARRVAERCGFVLEGILRHERRAPDGTLRSMCIYARFPHPG
jgi:RimJ/RimL family protein N-acetyltransferase